MIYGFFVLLVIIAALCRASLSAASEPQKVTTSSQAAPFTITVRVSEKIGIRQLQLTPLHCPDTSSMPADPPDFGQGTNGPRPGIIFLKLFTAQKMNGLVGFIIIIIITIIELTYTTNTYAAGRCCP